MLFFLVTMAHFLRLRLSRGTIIASNIGQAMVNLKLWLSKSSSSTWRASRWQGIELSINGALITHLSFRLSRIFHVCFWSPYKGFFSNAFLLTLTYSFVLIIARLIEKTWYRLIFVVHRIDTTKGFQKFVSVFLLAANFWSNEWSSFSFLTKMVSIGALKVLWIEMVFLTL